MNATRAAFPRTLPCATSAAPDRPPRPPAASRRLQRRGRLVQAAASGDWQKAAAVLRAALAPWGAGLAAAVVLAAPAAQAEDVETVFGKSCAGCHTGGGNIMR